MYKFTEKIEKKKAIVLLSTQRSGSSMVCKDIEDAQVLGSPFEYFLSVMRDISPQTIDDFFSNAQAEGSEYFSIKLMFNYLDKFGAFVTGSSDPLSDRVAAINFFKDNFEEVVFIYVRRSEYVDQGFSHLNAQLRGTWHKFSDGTTYYVDIYSDVMRRVEARGFFGELLNNVATAAVENYFLEALLQITATEYYTINYKEAARNYPGYLVKMCSDLSLPRPEKAVERGTKKIISDANDIEMLAEYTRDIGDIPSVSSLLTYRELDYTPTQFLMASIICRRVRNIKKAVAFARSALAQGVEASLNLADLFYYELGDIENSVKYYKLASQQASISYPHYQLSFIYNQMQEQDKALNEVRKAIALNDNNPGYYFHLGNLLKKSGSLEGAKDAQEKAIAIDPNLPRVHIQLSHIYMQLGDIEQAIKKAQDAIVVKDDNPNFYFHLESLLRKIGDFEGAREAQKKALMLKG